MGILYRMRKAESEAEDAGRRVLLAGADEKLSIKRRLVWLANTETDKRAKRVYRNAYGTIRI